MPPTLITMLTHHDETVRDAVDIFEECADLPCPFWGVKDIGLSTAQMERLVRRMKDLGKTTFLEVVSLTEPECLKGAKLALNCGFDYLMGTVFYPSVFSFLRHKPIQFFPFCGRVTGHPSVLEGAIDEVIATGKRLEKLGVHGFDLLAYRYVGDPIELARRFLNSVKLPVVIAGSVNSFERLNNIKSLGPWAFTIGSAFFDRVFVPGGTFRDQVERVLEYMNGIAS